MESSKYSFNLGNLEVSLTELNKNHIKLQRPVESKINSFSSSPKLQFQNLDFILKKQLYDRSFPVIRKTLWLASRRTANLGKKPVTYLVPTAIFKAIKSKENVQNSLPNFFVNKVFHVHKSVQCFSMKNLDTRKIQRFFVFANTEALLLESHFTAEDLKLFINPRVDRLHIRKMNIDFNYVVNFKKYLRSLMYFDPLPDDWENILFNSETQFGNLCLSEEKVVDYESMRNFVNRQPPDFVWFRHDKSTIYNQEFLKYFEQCNLENHDAPHIIYYSAETTIHFCPIISTTSKTQTPKEPSIVAH